MSQDTGAKIKIRAYILREFFAGLKALEIDPL